MLRCVNFCFDSSEAKSRVTPKDEDELLVEEEEAHIRTYRERVSPFESLPDLEFRRHFRFSKENVVRLTDFMNIPRSVTTEACRSARSSACASTSAMLAVLTSTGSQACPVMCRGGLPGPQSIG